MANCTILIPTHNRQNYLGRCANWFAEADYKVVIADSSTVEWASDIRSHSNITYIWVPGVGFSSYISKLKMALSAIETEYTNLCADDDFVFPSGIKKCTNFLDNNSDYSFAQGYSYQFQRFGNRVSIWPMQYKMAGAHSDDWIKRVACYRDTAYYGINRTRWLIDSINFLGSQNFDGINNCAPGFFDFAITSIVARRGKIQHINTPFALREYSSHVYGVGTLYQTICNNNVSLFYKNISNFLSDDSEPTERDEFIKICAEHYRDALLYDVEARASVSKRGMLKKAPMAIQTGAEEIYRNMTAAALFAKQKYRPMMSIFCNKELSLFKHALVTADRR
ncbi:MAG: TIGR00180 family glycosyltransferase [Rhodospirillaceae bacterium]